MSVAPGQGAGEGAVDGGLGWFSWMISTVLPRAGYFVVGSVRPGNPGNCGDRSARRAVAA